MFDDFYGLSGRPFQLTPDPAFFFESGTHRKALSYLGYGLAQGEGFVVITGEVGAGKSTLVAHLMASIDPAQLTAAHVVTSKLDGEEIVHVVAQAFGLLIEGHDKATALGAIEDFLHEEARAGRRCLLIVDESQNLSIDALEELRMLSNFQLGAHPLMQTLLLGQPEFRQTLADHADLEQLRQRVIATHHLEAMQPKEVQLYIEHRMKCVGWDGNPAFDQRVFAEIFEATGGVPRRINQIVNRLLLLGAVDQRTRIDGAMVQQVLSELSDDGSLSLVKPASVEPVVAEEAAEVSEPEMDEDDAGSPVADIAIFDELLEPADDDDSAIVQVDTPDEDEAFEEAHFEEAHFEEAHFEEGQFEEKEVAEPTSAPFAAPQEPVDSVAHDELDSALRERDEQIAELQQAVLELASASEIDKAEDEASAAELALLKDQVASLEGKLAEQDSTIRHTLTMLIEWIETGEGQRAAA